MNNEIEKEVEGIKNTLVDYAVKHSLCFSFETYRKNAEVLANAGYGKVEAAVRAFAQEIISYLDDDGDYEGFTIRRMLEDVIDNRYGTGNLCRCQNCRKLTPFTDAGGRCENWYGWLCHDCIKLFKSTGRELHFQDEEE